MQPTEDSVNRQLGRAVALARSEAGLTQAQLAARLGEALGKTVNTPTINRLEKGSRPTPLHEVYALAGVLGVAVEALLPEPDMVERLLRITDGSTWGAERQVEAAQKKLDETKENLAHAEWRQTSLNLLQDFQNGGKLEKRDVESVVDGVLISAIIYGDAENHDAFFGAFGIPIDAAAEFADQLDTYTQSKGDEPDYSDLLDQLVDLFMAHNGDRITDDDS